MSFGRPAHLFSRFCPDEAYFYDHARIHASANEEACDESVGGIQGVVHSLFDTSRVALAEKIRNNNYQDIFVINNR